MYTPSPTFYGAQVISELIKAETSNIHIIKIDPPLVRSKIEIYGQYSIIDRNLHGCFQVINGIICCKNWIILDLNYVGSYVINFPTFIPGARCFRMHIL